MIHRLEHSGLGYHIEAHQTADKLGMIQCVFVYCYFKIKVIF